MEEIINKAKEILQKSIRDVSKYKTQYEKTSGYHPHFVGGNRYTSYFPVIHKVSFFDTDNEYCFSVDLDEKLDEI